jgi:hypothetical protein
MTFENTGSAVTDYSIFVVWRNQLIMFRGKYFHIINTKTEEAQTSEMNDASEKWSYFPPIMYENKAIFVSYKDTVFEVRLEVKEISNLPDAYIEKSST